MQYHSLCHAAIDQIEPDCIYHIFDIALDCSHSKDEENKDDNEFGTMIQLQVELQGFVIKLARVVGLFF